MSSDEEYPPTRPSSPTMFASTTAQGSPGQEPSPSTAKSAMQTPVFSESTTPIGSPQAGASTPGYDMTELSPPRFLLGRKPVQDNITVAGPSTPRFPAGGDHEDDHAPLSSPADASASSGDRDALPSQSRPNSVGSAQASEQFPSRHGPGARMVQLPEASSRQHRRSKTMTNMADDLPGPLFARTPSPVPGEDGTMLPGHSTGEETDEDPFVGTPLAHLSRGYRPVYESSPTIPGPSNQAVSINDFADQGVPGIGVQSASTTTSLDSDETVEDETLYTGHVQKDSSSPDGSPDRKKGLGLFSDRAGDYDLALGKTFVGTPLDPEQMKEEEVRFDYPLDEINGGEDDLNVGVYDFAYCAGQAPQTERQWETVQVWEPLYENHPWPLVGMPLSQILDENNATVIVEMDDMNMEDETVQEVYQGSFKSLAVRDSKNDSQEQVVAEGAGDIVDHAGGSVGEGDDELSSENGSGPKAKRPTAETMPENTLPTMPADTATPGSSTYSASTPFLGGAPLGQSTHHKRSLWGRIGDFFCYHRNGDRDEQRKGFWRRQLNRFKGRKE